MRIGLLQFNPTVGDITGNTVRLIDAIQSMEADIIVTPELSICGYPPRDLLYLPEFVHACEDAVQQIAMTCNTKSVLVGHPRVNQRTERVRNSVSVLQQGEISAVSDKLLLPSYDIFDEKRYFESGDSICTFTFGGTQIGVPICEDFWRGFDANAADQYDENPIEQYINAGCRVLICPSASPFVVGKQRTHLEYAVDLARENKLTIAMCNQVGANDDLIFDGGSFVVTAKGLSHECPRWLQDAVCIDTTMNTIEPVKTSIEEELFHALVLGVRDYFSKTGHVDALLGVSGGIDSALVATIAVAALGKEHVKGVLLPSRFSSLGSVEDAEALLEALGCTGITLPIGYMHDAFERTLAVSSLEANGIAGENAQARIRGLLLMALANEHGSLLLATGNKSELAVGYSTLYGDMDGAVSVIGDVYKTDVWSLSTWINSNYQSCGFTAPPIPESSITKEPSAELRPHQTDQDSLPEYQELDSVLRLHIDSEMDVESIEDELNIDVAAIQSIVTMVDRAQFKREQAAVILKTSPRSFGRGRRMPIVMRQAWVRSRETT